MSHLFWGKDFKEKEIYFWRNGSFKNFCQSNGNNWANVLYWSEGLSTYIEIFTPKKFGFSPVKILPKIYLIFFYLYSMQLFQCGRCNIFKKNLNYFVAHENLKKRASKVAHNRPQTSFSQYWPGCPNQARIDFSYYKYVPRLICLLICLLICGPDPMQCTNTLIVYLFFPRKYEKTIQT